MKFSICTFVSKTDKKGNITYSLKTLQTVTAKKNSEGRYTAQIKGLLLEKDDYYFCVESTNAKKGGDATYSLFLNKNDSHFFNTNTKTNSNDDDWDDMKTKGPAGKVVSFGEISTKNLDKVILNDWVGFGDAVDYRRFSIKANAKISFSIQAEDSAKFTIYKLVSKTDKKGNTSYSLKTLQSTNIKAGTDKWTETNLLKLDIGEDYYFSMQSTNAKKGGDAYYKINLKQFNPLDGKALTGPEEINGWNGVEAAASADLAIPGNTASPDTSVAGAADAVQDVQTGLFAGQGSVQADSLADAGILSPDSPSERLFGDSTGSLLASL